MPDRLLIVDDEEALRDQLSGHFRRAGYEVATAGSGREALEKAAAGPGHSRRLTSRSASRWAG